MEDIRFSEYYISKDLDSNDPYDIWKTWFGLEIKNIFNRNRLVGAGSALILSLFDIYINNELRISYKKQEYPIVRALAAQILLNQYQQNSDKTYLSRAECHLDWLADIVLSDIQDRVGILVSNGLRQQMYFMMLILLMPPIPLTYWRHFINIRALPIIENMRI